MRKLLSLFIIGFMLVFSSCGKFARMERAGAIPDDPKAAGWAGRTFHADHRTEKQRREASACSGSTEEVHYSMQPRNTEPARDTVKMKRERGKHAMLNRAAKPERLIANRRTAFIAFIMGFSGLLLGAMAIMIESFGIFLLGFLLCGSAEIIAIIVLMIVHRTGINYPEVKSAERSGEFNSTYSVPDQGEVQRSLMRKYRRQAIALAVITLAMIGIVFGFLTGGLNG